ncbi:MAG TPA: PAS domain-containing protein [Phenylobacterium sp.]|nr:PAS domain-containing protein [Phenylobacterium sp.]
MDDLTDSLVLDDPIVRSAAEAATLGMAFQIETAPDGSRRFLHLGGRCLAVTGVAPEIALADAEALYGLIAPAHREIFERAAAQAQARREPFDVEVAMRRPDGDLRWHRIAALPNGRADGTVLWDGLQIDVTRRREMAAELEEQRRRVEVAVEATDLGLWEIDVRSGRLDWSATNRALFGLAEDAEVTIDVYLDLVHPEDREGVQAAYLATRDGASAPDLKMDYRIRRPAGEVRWLHSRGRIIRDEQGPRRLVGTTLDITERKAAEEGRNLLLGELAHRAKNGIAVIMAIVSQTARGQDSVAAFEATLMARLQAMATSQDFVMASEGRPVDLAGLLRQALTAFGLSRFRIDPALEGVTIEGQLAVGMGLLLHELATNATKYGALSVTGGCVSLCREVAPEGRGAFTWIEAGGPAVTPPVRQGFGSRLLEQSLRFHGGKVTYAFDSEGFRAQAEFPLAS